MQRDRDMTGTGEGKTAGDLETGPMAAGFQRLTATALRTAGAFAAPFPSTTLCFAVAMLLGTPSPALATEPISASIELETYARRCPPIPQTCGGPTDILVIDVASDAQPADPLAPLSAMSQAVAGTPGLDAYASTSMNMNVNFSSASAGSLGFSGETGIGRPTVGFADQCTSLNNRSEGLTYVFVADTDGEIEIDFAFECMPLLFTTASAEMVFYLDDFLIGRPFVSASDPQKIGTITRNISAGTTHTLRIMPDMNGVGGTGCGPPPGWAWSCTGSAAWSIDSAPPVPAPAASGPGFLGLTLCLLGIGAAGLARRSGTFHSSRWPAPRR